MKELLAATVIFPLLISLLADNMNSKMAAIDYVMYFTFSFMLHIHLMKSSYNMNTRHMLFRLYIAFMYMQSMITSYARFMEISTFEILYHILSILYILLCPEITQTQKNQFNAICVIGILISSHGLFHKNSLLCASA